MNSVVDAGELRDVIYIQSKDDNVDEFGLSRETYTTLYKLRSKVKTINLKVNERLVAERDTSTHSLKFICRQRKGIDNKMFILYEDVRYNITNVHKMDDFFFEITAQTSY